MQGDNKIRWANGDEILEYVSRKESELSIIPAHGRLRQEDY